jgi:hypothetical protein
MLSIYREYREELKREREEQREMIKKQKEEHIKNFIISKCEITSNHQDRIQASLLYDKISNAYSTLDKINSTTMKTIILSNEGILQRKTNGCKVYYGLKLLDD